MKTCSCGKVWLTIPSHAKLKISGDEFLDGYYWECVCKSTLFVPLKRMECAA